MAREHSCYESQAAGRWVIDGQKEKVDGLKLTVERLRSQIESAIIYEDKSPDDADVKAMAAELAQAEESHRVESLELWSANAKYKLQFGEEALSDLIEDQIGGWI